MKFKEKLYRFMYGRYGMDSLYNFCNITIIVLLLVSLVLSFIIKNELTLAIVNFSILLIEIFLISWSTFRSFSKNISRRRRENEIFLKAKSGIKRFFTLNTQSKTKSNNADTFQYIFRDCNKCGATLRLPRKAGRHSVKCPRCSHKFYVKAKKLKKN